MGGTAPPTPPLLLSCTKRASKPKKLVDTHHVSRVFANWGGGCVFPQPPSLLLSRTKRASKPEKLVEKKYESDENIEGMIETKKTNQIGFSRGQTKEKQRTL